MGPIRGIGYYCGSLSQERPAVLWRWKSFPSTLRLPKPDLKVSRLAAGKIPTGATLPDVPAPSPDKIREALLALEGTVVGDIKLPLPGDLKEISKAASLVSGIIEDRIPSMLNQVRERTWDEDGELHAYEFRRFTIGFPDILLVERANAENVLFELEAKSWYVLSGDALTARFDTSVTAMREGTLVAVVAWMLDGVVSGSPKLSGSTWTMRSALPRRATRHGQRKAKPIE